ncbi:stalk domain-containing protein [Paenibacillus xerothermodurans]|uniref:Copper amine oxidase N-terminal domain-containing protein n=1 Tax=Paenibacillus xerothermodurans TaxID=1977292 RepID=A0A2W1NA38_PAEXE|nr:stalk domain-containing protein [Paenibacillus xerothermodurans]PZE21509.1 copper amine oxidase N-terminal domain-containing protein [Paenibacillus xerothermodurans]
MMRRTILALMIGMLLGSVSTAVAAIQGEVTAVFANFVLKINGQAQPLDNAPLVHEGNSFLPVRELADLFGYDVAYDDAARTIELNDRSRSKSPANSEPVDSSKWISLRELTLAGVKTTISPGTSKINVEFGSRSFSFNLPNTMDAEKITTSDTGDITMLIKDGTTYLNRSDLERLGLL